MKKILVALSLVLGLQISQAVGQNVVAEEVVAVVGNMTIMLSDVEREAARMVDQSKENGFRLRRDPKSEALEMLLTQKLLASKAKADSLDKEMSPVDDRVESIVSGMVKQAGGIRELERKMGKAIFMIRSEMKSDLEEMQMAQMMEQKIRSKVSVNGPDVEQFYANIPVDSLPLIPQQYIYAQIVRSPPNNDARKFEIRERLLSYRQRVLSGERFSTLATLYSQDRGTALRGGEIGPQPLETLVKPFVDAVELLKPGQVSEIVETEFGFHIIELISLNEGQVHLRHLLLTPEFTVEETYKAARSLDSLTQLIRSGELTFEQAALKESDDKNSKMNGGMVFNTKNYYQTGDVRNASNRFVVDELDMPEYRALNRMKVGDVSESFESIDISNIVYKIVKLVDIIPSHAANLVYDYAILESATITDKQNREIDRWIDNAIVDTYIYIAPRYRDYDFERSGWIKPYRSLIEKATDTIK